MTHVVVAKSDLFNISCKVCGSDWVNIHLINEPIEMGHELGNVIRIHIKCKGCGKEEWVADTTV